MKRTFDTLLPYFEMAVGFGAVLLALMIALSLGMAFASWLGVPLEDSRTITNSITVSPPAAEGRP